MTGTSESTFAGQRGRRKPPTLKHRPAIWENLLGTVMAKNDAGEVRYFDYDREAAAEFAGVSPDRDPRIAVNVRVHAGDSGPRVGQWALWILREDPSRVR